MPVLHVVQVHEYPQGYPLLSVAAAIHKTVLK